MAKDVPAKVNITAHLDSTAEGGIRWEMQSKFKHQKDLVFHNDKIGDEFLITFDLDDKTGLRLVFPDCLDDAIWVSAGVEKGIPECPKLTACYNEVFKAVGISPQGSPTKLTVRNKNDKIENIAFSLRFVPRNKDQNDPQNFVIFDPISQNKNGGTPLQESRVSTVVVLLGLGAAALLGYLVYLSSTK